MLTLFSDSLFEEHETPGEHPECPERARAVNAGLQGLDVIGERRGAVVGEFDDVARVHDPRYVRALKVIAEQGGGALDPDTWISPRSYDVALAASGTVVAAAESVLPEGAPPAFAVVRPPGHHARPAKGMGFCLFNNVAVAAARLRDEHGLARVAVLDFDVHHGNGTQDCFYEDPSVLFLSWHRSPFYPGTGHADETGSAEGLGATKNYPLTGNTKPKAYRDAFRAGLDAVASFKPDAILVSGGFDAYVDDPIGGLNLDVEDFRWIGAELKTAADQLCQGRIAVTLEGGYAVDALGDIVAQFCTGLVQGS